jgi:hypothetical protein
MSSFKKQLQAKYRAKISLVVYIWSHSLFKRLNIRVGDFAYLHEEAVVRAGNYRQIIVVIIL